MILVPGAHPPSVEKDLWMWMPRPLSAKDVGRCGHA